MVAPALIAKGRHVIERPDLSCNIGSRAEGEAVEHMSGREARNFNTWFMGGLLLGILTTVAEAMLPMRGLHALILDWCLLVGSVIFGIAVVTSAPKLPRRVQVFRELLLLPLPLLSGVVLGVLPGSPHSECISQGVVYDDI